MQLDTPHRSGCDLPMIHTICIHTEDSETLQRDFSKANVTKSKVSRKGLSSNGTQKSMSKHTKKQQNVDLKPINKI
jgi:hypothetical protein